MVSSNLKLSPNRVKHQELAKHTDEIVDLYVNQLWSTRKIAIDFGTEKGAISSILRGRNIQLHGTRTRDYSLTCQDCQVNFSSKCPTRLRCESCNDIERNRQARKYQRQFAKHDIADKIKCLKCHCTIENARLGREYCDGCRQARLNDLKRERRAKNPEKYRLKDKQYNQKSYATKVPKANRRARQYGKSVIAVVDIRRTFILDNYICQYCYQRGGNLTVDHIVPLCDGGENNDSNFVTACRTCNVSKNKKSLLNFLLYMNARERN